MRINIQKKVVLLYATAIVLFFSLCVVSYFVSKNIILDLSLKLLDAKLENGYTVIMSSNYFKTGDLKDLKALHDDLLAIKVGRSGYPYILDSEGGLIIHPVLEGKNIWKSKDADGHYFIQEIVKKRNGQITYPWQNPSETSAREKIAVYRSIDQKNWVLGLGAYSEEVFEGLYIFEKVIFIVVTLIMIIMGGIIFYIYTIMGNFAKEMLKNNQTIFKGINNIFKGNTDIAMANKQQRESFAQVAVELDKVETMLKQTAENGQEATTLSISAVDLVKSGKESSENAQTAMEEIAKSSGKISDIISLVEDIAFQTNILAINAAIEAAKAGEQGKGFAVVAIEVRDLSRRSTEATKEIKALIESSVGKVKNGERLVYANKEGLEQIADVVLRLSSIMGMLLEANKGQYLSIDEMSSAIKMLNQSTENNGHQVDSMKNLSAELSQKAKEVSDSVQNFFF